jgi:hypothetical protein
VPKGEGLDAAIFGPQEVAFEEGHLYSLAIIGEIEDDSLSLLVLDETEAFAEADPTVDYMMTLVHDIQGAPPIEFSVDLSAVIENLGYGQFDSGWRPEKPVRAYPVNTPRPAHR